MQRDHPDQVEYSLGRRGQGCTEVCSWRQCRFGQGGAIQGYQDAHRASAACEFRSTLPQHEHGDRTRACDFLCHASQRPAFEAGIAMASIAPFDIVVMFASERSLPGCHCCCKYELVLLSRFDLVRLNFTRFVATQNIKRLLLAAISFNRHYRSSGLELPCIMARIVFRQTHTDESADNPASRGSYCRTRQGRYQDSACNHGTDSGDQEYSRRPKETSKDSPAHSISAFINLPPPLSLSHFGLFISCRNRLPSDCGFTFFLFSFLLSLAPHPIYSHFRHRYPAYRHIARIRRANNR